MSAGNGRELLTPGPSDSCEENETSVASLPGWPLSYPQEKKLGTRLLVCEIRDATMVKCPCYVHDFTGSQKMEGTVKRGSLA